MQSVGFDFFFAGEPDESVEAVEVESFKVGTPAKKDGILDCRCAFWIAFAMSALMNWNGGITSEVVVFWPKVVAHPLIC